MAAPGRSGGLSLAWLLALLACPLVVQVRAVERVFFLAAVEVDWDYAPQGNLVNDPKYSGVYLNRTNNRIGRVYSKVVYRQFTDGTFQTPVPSPAWLGLLGPVIRAEVGDRVIIYFRNLAFRTGRPFTVHPHGVFYFKKHEGALYLDGTHGKNKLDDGVPPGYTYKYIWDVTESFAPTADDDNCVPWAYHSHVSSASDVDTGMLGVLLTCKRGILNLDGSRTDVNREYVIYTERTDENYNWRIKENLHRCLNPSECQRLHALDLLDSMDARTFRYSNHMSNINGYSYGNLPDLVVHEGEKTLFHFLSLGYGPDTLHLNGHVFVVQKQRKNTISLFPATFRTAELVSCNPGTWLLSSAMTNYIKAGVQAFVHVLPSPHPSMHPSSFGFGTRRRYFIGAHKIFWNYAPSGLNLYSGGNLTDEGSASKKFFERTHERIGGTYVKAVFVGYTGPDFKIKTARGPHEHHLGILGPLIKAEVGDTVEVVFRNMADRPYSFFPSGVIYDKHNEGYVYRDPLLYNTNNGVFARPGETVTYVFKVPEGGAGPTDHDSPCLTYSYQSAVDPIADLHAGLVGPMVICKQGELGQDFAAFKGMDWYSRHRHFFILYHTFDENESHYLDENIHLYTAGQVDKENEDFQISNRMHGLNGLMYGNLGGLDTCLAQPLAWHLMGKGSYFDLHGANVQGVTLSHQGNTMESHVLLPGVSVVMTSIPDKVGQWSVHCGTNAHFEEGMMATFQVRPCGAHPDHFTPTSKRTYFIAAVEDIWDYAPVHVDLISGEHLNNPSQRGYLFVRNDTNFIGTRFLKALYREFTDATFTHLKPRGPDEEHLNILGPMIKAEIGDVVEVVFKNMASRPYSIHPQSLAYDKASEGARYRDGDPHKADDAVPPGGVYVYRWTVPKRSGPGKNDPNCIARLYHSATSYPKDVNSGLVGPLVICNHGVLDSRGRRTDVDREFALLFFGFDENHSWYLDYNTRRFAPNRMQNKDKQFEEANEKYSMNGRLFGNLHGLVMQTEERVAWYVLGMGTLFDVHPVHFHGQTFLHRSGAKVHRGDVIEVFPTTSETVEMRTDNPGTWIVHCHLSYHARAGMEAVYTILPRAKLDVFSSFPGLDLGHPLLIKK